MTTTDSQQQIAREAADEIHDGGIRCRSALNQIILSAIERAIQQDFVCGTCGASANNPQPQRSEQYDLNRIVPVTEIEKLQRSEQPATAGLRQEWTNDDSYIYEGSGFSVKSLGRTWDERDAKTIVDAHNAAIQEYKEKAWKYDKLNK